MIRIPEVITFTSRKRFQIGESYRVAISNIPGLYKILKWKKSGDEWEYEALREAPWWRN